MKKYYFSIIIMASLSTGVLSHAAKVDSKKYYKPVGPVANYTFIIPSSWKEKSSILQNEETHIFTKGSAAIRVRALFSESSDIIEQLRLKKWEMRSIDPSFRPLIDGEDVVIRKSANGKLMLFDYKDKKKKTAFIQRTFITTNGSCVYIVDCTAPVKSFTSFEPDFTAAMGSFKITGKPAGSYTPPKKEPIIKKTEPVKEAQPEPKPVDKSKIKIDTEGLSEIEISEEKPTQQKEDITDSSKVYEKPEQENPAQK